VEQPQASEGSPGVSASLRYVEAEPRGRQRQGSFWLLLLEMVEANP
jgi:hypothetical protein